LRKSSAFLWLPVSQSHRARCGGRSGCSPRMRPTAWRRTRQAAGAAAAEVDVAVTVISNRRGMLRSRDVSCGLPKQCHQHTQSASTGGNDPQSNVTPGQAEQGGKDQERSVKTCYRNGGWDREQIQLLQHDRVSNGDRPQLVRAEVPTNSRLRLAYQTDVSCRLTARRGDL
jgi:hypothetical protein